MRVRPVRLRLHIQELAEARGFTRTKLARKADLNYDTINSVWLDETEKVISIYTLIRIAQALNVSVTDLYTVIDE